MAGTPAAAIAYVGEFHSDKTRPKHITFTAMFMTLSIIYMSAIGWLIMPSTWSVSLLGFIYRPWRFYIFCSSTINIAAFVYLLYLPESPKFLLVMGKKDEALDIIKGIYKFNTGHAKDVSLSYVFDH